MKRNHFKWIALSAALAVSIGVLSARLLAAPAKPRPSASPTVLALASPTPSTTPAAYVSPSPVPLLPSPPAAQPKITWSPTSSTEVILSPNETTTKDFTFRSDQPLQNVVLEPVPALAPFLNVQPNSFTSVPAGQPQAVRVNFVIPAAARLGTYDGTIHLRRGSQTLPQTLKAVVNVWQSVTATSADLSLKLPPGWSFVQPEPGFMELKDTSVHADPLLEEPPNIAIYIDDNPSGLPPSRFYDGTHYPAYYQDSQSVSPFAACGSSGLAFTGVLGETTSDVVILPMTTKYARFVNYGDPVIFQEVLNACSLK